MSSGSGSSDDPSIEGNDTLYRRIANVASPDFIATDSVTGARSPSSGVFKSKDVDGLSVYLHSVLSEAQLVPADLVREPNNGVCSILVAPVRGNGLGVIRDPWPPGADDPTHLRHGAHALVTGMTALGSKEARRVARRLAQVSMIVIDPVA